VSWHVERSGSGPDLVLLHGWGLHSGAWTDLIPALGSRWRVHAIDIPGHGHSAHVEAGTFDEATGRLANLVPKGATVCGWSLGGLLAQNLASRHPDRVARLALVATTPCFVARPDWPHGMKEAAFRTFSEGLANDRDAMLRRFVALNALHGPQGRDAVRRFTARLAERGPPSDRTLGVTLGWLRDVDLRERARQLRLPTSIVHGSRDVIVPVGAGNWLWQNIPDSTLHEIPEAAHMPFYSHPAQLIGALEALSVA
jgi:pimeloyl-[acyl-carrier protein] methyl ester esterase